MAGPKNDTVIRILLEEGSDPNIQSRCNNTTLHEAATFGNAELTKLLLEHKAKVDLKDVDGKTALERATEGGFPSVMKLFDSKLSSTQDSRM